jgi:putative holliday junction resolvase
VVGLPLSLSGAVGPAARAVLEEVTELTDRLSVPVVTHDERFSTVVATRSLRQAARGRTVKSARRRSGEVDQAAAAVFLQAWLDGGGARAL